MSTFSFELFCNNGSSNCIFIIICQLRDLKFILGFESVKIVNHRDIIILKKFVFLAPFDISTVLKVSKVFILLSDLCIVYKNIKRYSM